MGASGSTRKIVVEDTDGVGVVKISESVVRRIKGQPDQDDQGQSGSQQSQSSQSSESRPNRPKEVIIERPVYYPSPVKDSSQATKDIEAFYQHKLKQLEERNAQLQKITTEQFAKAVQEVEKKFIKQTGSPVCEDMQQKVYNCYHTNAKRTLNCWQEVGAFTNCVERARQNALARRG